jgi:hypothetical protein
MAEVERITMSWRLNQHWRDKMNDRIQYLLDVIKDMEKGRDDWLADRADILGAAQFQEVADEAKRALNALIAA